MPTQEPTPPVPQIDVAQVHLVHAHKHNSPLVSCRFDPTGRFVFFGAQDNRVWRWDAATDAKVEYAAHDSWVRAIGFHAAENHVLTGGYDGRLIWWPVAGESPKPLRTIDAHDGWLRALAVSPDASLVATVGNDLLVKLWRMDDGQLVREMSGHERHVYHVAFHPDGKQLATGDLMGNLRHWEVDSGKLAREFKIDGLHKYDTTFKADIGGFRDLRFSADGSRLACAGITNVTNAFAGVGNPLVVLVDWATGEPAIAYQSKGNLKGVAWGVAVHPGEFTIGLSGGGGGGFLLFWKSDEKEDYHRLKLPNIARDLDLSPDLVHLATAHYDGHIRLVKMAAKEEASETKGDTK